MKANSLRTADEARAWLEDHGVTQAEFARTHNLDYQTVRNVTAGRSKGRYGEAHRAAVLLGIKPPPKGQSPLPQPLSH